MARLPTPGGDEGSWGDVLNDYLSQSLTPSGAIKPDAISTSQLADNSVTSAQLAPDAVTGPAIANGAVAESHLSSGVQTKLNAPSAVTSVSTKTGDVTLTKSDVGLSNVDNTSDAAKPVSTAQQTALDLKRDKKNQAEVTLTSSTDFIEKYSIVNDSTSSSGWPNRREIKMTPVGGGTPRLVQYENEYGEKRIIARQNTVAWRAYVREYTADPAHSMAVPIWEIQDDRNTNTPLHRMFGDGDFLHTGDGTIGGDLTITGSVTAQNIGVQIEGVYDSGDEPVGQPVGTVILVRP